MKTETHKRRHAELHAMLDELVADWLTETGKQPSEASVWELMQWSNAQTEPEPHCGDCTGDPAGEYPHDECGACSRYPHQEQEQAAENTPKPAGLLPVFVVTDEALARMDKVADRIREDYDPDHKCDDFDTFIRQTLVTGVACCCDTIEMPKRTPTSFGRFSEHCGGNEENPEIPVDKPGCNGV